MCAVFVICTLLSACGFSPLYGTGGETGPTSVAVSDALSAVTIRPIADRDGMKLRQALRERMQPRGQSATLYDLDVQMRSVVQEIGVRRDATASRANVIYTARFVLNEGGQRIYSDQVQTIVSYNILDDQYASVAAVGDAGDRAIKQLGDEIRMRLAIFFDSRLQTARAERTSVAQ
jgi:LPS-assembly lipoprotein